MSIEVRQLVVKGEIHAGPESRAADSSPALDLDAFRDELLEQCRRLLEELLEERRER